MSIHRLGRSVVARACTKVPLLIALSLFAGGRVVRAGFFSLDINSTLTYTQGILAQIGPTLSAVLFITAGIFYALGQLMPPTRRANMHSTAVDIIIGAVIVAALSVTAGSFAYASAHLLQNMSSNALATNAV